MDSNPLLSVMEASVEAWAEGGAYTSVVAFSTLEAGLRDFVAVEVRAALSQESFEHTQLTNAEQRCIFEPCQPLLDRVKAERINSVVNHIRKFAEMDGIPCRDAETVVEAMRGIVTGWIPIVVSSKHPFGPEEQEKLVDRVIELLLASRRVW